MTVHSMSSDWMIFSGGAPGSRTSKQETGDLFVATFTSSSEQVCMLRAPPWHFVYEGTIEDGEALRDVLDPTGSASDELPGTPGDVIFAHILACLGDLRLTPDMAMAKAASDLHRAGRLGCAAFLCADTTNLYAYALGHRLFFKNVSDAILVGSADIIGEGLTTRALQDGALVAFARRPQLGWAVLAHP